MIKCLLNNIQEVFSVKKILSLITVICLIAAFALSGITVFADESTVPHKGEYELSDQSEGNETEEGVAAGYWMHPFNIGEVLSVTFTNPFWMNGFSFYAWTSDFEQFMDIELKNAKGVVVWSGRKVCAGNNLNEVAFDRSFPAGEYTICFINAENPEYPNGVNQHFVLGSGYVRVDLEPEDITVKGYHGLNTLGAPQITLYEGDEDPNYVDPDPTPTPVPTEVPSDYTGTPVPRGTYPLSDTSEGHVDASGNAAGYWMHPFVPGDVLEVLFNTPMWFSGFTFYSWCAYCDTYVDINLLNDKEEVLWTGRCTCYGNDSYEIEFDISFPPGVYAIDFVMVENPAYPEGINQHFVLGSGLVREDLDNDDVIVFGFGGSNSLGAPEIVLLEGDADPNYATPENPTAKPTNTPTAEPTQTPAPETEAPTETPEPENKGCGGIAFGAAPAIIAAGCALLIKRRKRRS